MKEIDTSSRNVMQATISLLKDGTVRAHTVAEGMIEFPPDAISEFCKLPDKSLWGKGVRIDGAIRTNNNSTQLYAIQPWDLQPVVRFLHFAAKKDELPAPQLVKGGERPSPRGGTFYAEDKLIMILVVEILEPKNWAGLETTLISDYLFVPGDKGMCALQGSGPKRQKCKDLLRLCGVDLDEVDIKYNPNILPELENMMLSVKQKPFILDIKGGKLENYQAAPESLARVYAGKAAPAQQRAASKPKPDTKPGGKYTTEAPAKKTPAPKAKTNTEDTVAEVMGEQAGTRRNPKKEEKAPEPPASNQRQRRGTPPAEMTR